MKKGIHPEYREVVFMDVQSNFKFLTRSTIKSKEKQIENVNEITRSASQLYDKYATLKSYLKKLVTSYNSHAKNLRSVIKTGWAGNANLEKQIINLKEKHGITAGKNIEKTLPEEDRIEDIDDPEDKGPYVN